MSSVQIVVSIDNVSRKCERENMDTLDSNVPVPEPLLISVISSCQEGTHQMSDNICVYDKNVSLLENRKDVD
jgi:hypothetical protein